MMVKKRGIVLLALLLAVCMSFAACGKGGDKPKPKPIEAESVSLNETNITLYEDETFQLTATVKPDNCENKSVTFTSSAVDIASVSASGLITAKKDGNATITAKTANGKTATCAVAVQAYTVPDEQKFTVACDASDYLSFSATINGETKYEGKEATITVLKNGVAAGKVNATVDNKNSVSFLLSECEGISGAGEYVFEIATPFAKDQILDLAAELNEIEQNYTFTLTEGWQDSPSGEGTLKANGRVAVVGDYSWGWVTKTIKVDFDKASIVDVKIKNASHNWVVKVSGNGIAQSVVLFQEGTAEQSKHEVVDLKTFTSDWTTTTGKADITFDVFATGDLAAYVDMEYFRLIGSEAEPITLAKQKDYVALTDFAFDSEKLNAKMGENIELPQNISFTPSDASNQRLKFGSSDETVFKVNANGVLEPVGVGDATLTATSADGKITKTISVNVRVAATGMSLANTSGTFELKDEFVQLQPVFTPVNATNQNVDYSVVSGTATVDKDGKVSFTEVGESTIKATAQDGGFEATYVLTVKANVIRVTEVLLDTTNFNGEIGETKQLIATVLPANADDKSLTFVSSDTKVATVSAEGLVEIVGNGTAKIIVTTNDGGKTVECSVTCYATYDFAFNPAAVYDSLYLAFENNGNVTEGMYAALDVMSGDIVGKTVTAPITLTRTNALLKAVVAVSEFAMVEAKDYEIVIRIQNGNGDIAGNGYALHECLLVDAKNAFNMNASGGWTAGGAPLTFDTSDNLVLAQGGEPYGWIQRDVTIDFDKAPYLVIKVDSVQTLWSVVFNINNQDVKVTPDIQGTGIFVVDLRNAEDIHTNAGLLGDRTGLLSATFRIFLNATNGPSSIPEGGAKTKISAVGFYGAPSDFEFTLDTEEVRLIDQTAQVTANVQNGAEGYEIAYESANAAVATVDDAGLITPVAPGYTVVSVKYMVDGIAEAQKTVAVYVGASFVWNANAKYDYVLAEAAALAADQPVYFAIYRGAEYIGKISSTCEAYNRVAVELSALTFTDGEDYQIYAYASNSIQLTKFEFLSATKAEVKPESGWVNSGAQIDIPSAGTMDIKAGYGFMDFAMEINMDEFDYFFWKVESLTAGVAQSFGIRTQTGVSYFTRGWGPTGEGIGVALKSQVCAESTEGANAEMQALTGVQQVKLTILLESPGGEHLGQKISFGAVCHTELNLLA